MQPLIDADVLIYEVGFGAETAWEGTQPPPFDRAADLLENKISHICAQVDATAPPILFLTGKSNFRFDIAKRAPYKARPGNKPFHYYNLRAYMQSQWDTRITEGIEADDAISIEQTSRPLQTIICTRDKDLRQVGGWHFGWELGNQPQFGPELVREPGYLRLSKDGKKLSGTGTLFFYSQLLTGDKVDNIPGCPGIGPAKAFKILDGCVDMSDALKRVYGAYKALYGLSAYKEMLEQGRLLWMVRQLREDGSPVLWGQTS